MSDNEHYLAEELEEALSLLYACWCEEGCPRHKEITDLLYSHGKISVEQYRRYK